MRNRKISERPFGSLQIPLKCALGTQGQYAKLDILAGVLIGFNGPAASISGCFALNSRLKLNPWLYLDLLWNNPISSVGCLI